MCRRTRHLASAKSATDVAFIATFAFAVDSRWLFADILVGPSINSDNKPSIVVQCIMDDRPSAIG
jgi:hypothetical protein